MNRAQRIILVIAAAVLALVVDAAVTVSAVDGGWYGYAPGTAAMLLPGVDAGRQVLVRLALLAAWTLLALRLLADAGVDTDTDADTDAD
jgi:hypothetical protein